MPPEIIFPLEQSTIVIIVGILKVDGVLPIAVTTKLKVNTASAFEGNITLLMSVILAP